jgi:hypothetical protein
MDEFDLRLHFIKCNRNENKFIFVCILSNIFKEKMLIYSCSTLFLIFSESGTAMIDSIEK